MVWFPAFAGTTPGFRVKPGITSMEVVQRFYFTVAGLSAIAGKSNEKTIVMLDLIRHPVI